MPNSAPLSSREVHAALLADKWTILVYDSLCTWSYEGAGRVSLSDGERHEVCAITVFKVRRKPIEDWQEVDPDAVEPYVKTIAQNLALDVGRRKRRAPRALEESEPPTTNLNMQMLSDRQRIVEIFVAWALKLRAIRVPLLGRLLDESQRLGGAEIFRAHLINLSEDQRSADRDSLRKLRNRLLNLRSRKPTGWRQEETEEIREIRDVMRPLALLTEVDHERLRLLDRGSHRRAGYRARLALECHSAMIDIFALDLSHFGLVLNVHPTRTSIISPVARPSTFMAPTSVRFRQG